jgi:glycosyltransferase involved in cell wall biosynthesis
VRLAAFVPYAADTTPSQRFRIEQWTPHLAEQGIDVDLLPFAEQPLMRLLYEPGRSVAKAGGTLAAFVRRFGSLAVARRYDAFVVHRAACLAGPALIERLLAHLGRPLLFDFDDAIFMLHTSAANRRFAWLKFPGKTAAICRVSTAVVVGNNYLADYARQHNPRVTIVPTSVDVKRYQPRPRAATGPVVVGWTGSSTSQTHLEAFAPVLRELLARRNVVLRVFSDREPVLPGIACVWRRWSPSVEDEVRELEEFDIGIMPVPDDPWARGKCALKALQYMAMGIPTIVSAVGTNREVIEDGRNGFLVTTPEEWLSRLESLVDDAALRQRLGSAGRATVEQHYSAQRCASLFGGVVRASLGV